MTWGGIALFCTPFIGQRHPEVRLDNRFVSFLIWGTPYPAFIFLVDLYKQMFAMIILSYSSTFSKHLLIFHTNAQSPCSNKYLIFVLLLILYKIDLTFNLECSLVSMHKPVKLQSQSTDGIIKSSGTPSVSKWVFHLEIA